MEEKELNDNFRMLSDDLKKYVRVHMDLNIITLFERSSKMSRYLITRVLIILLAFFVLRAGVMAFVYWYHKVYGSFIEPFIISAVGFVVLIGAVLLFRKR